MNKVTIIAGPCSVESREQIIRIAKKLKELPENKKLVLEAVPTEREVKEIEEK